MVSVLRSFAFLLVACCLTACASMGKTSGLRGGLVVSDDAQAGEVFGSLVLPEGGKEPTYMRYQIDIRPVGKPGSIFLALTNTIFEIRDSYDVHMTGYRGKSFRQVVPAGDYEIVNIRMSSDTGMVAMNFTAREPFSVPFHVGAGETVYLGRFLARGVWGKGMLGNKIPAGGYFEVRNHLGEDAVLARAKGADVRAESAHVANLEPTGDALLFLRPAR